VQAALKTLPWVEKDTIKVNVGKHEVKFGVKEKGNFNEKAVKEALATEGFNEVTVKSGPT
jgi:hypothetical protein